MGQSQGVAKKKGVYAGIAVLVLGGGYFLAKMFGPKNPSARQCFETEAEDDNQQWTPEEYERLHHLAYDFVSCRDGCDDEGDAYSCRNVAYIYSMGKGLRYEGGVDYAKAADYAQIACSISRDTECAMASRYRCYQDVHACEARCARGQGADCASLAAKSDRKGKPDYDADRAIRFHERACELGQTDSCGKAVQHLCLERPTDCAERCKEGSAATCFKLGEFFDYGGGNVSKNPQKAVEFKRRACEIDAQVHASCSKVLTEAQISL